MVSTRRHSSAAGDDSPKPAAKKAKAKSSKKPPATKPPATPTKPSSKPSPSTPTPGTPPSSKKPPKSPQKPSHLPSLPPHFSSLHSLVLELRSDRTAPVDSNGAEALCLRDPSDPRVYRYHVLIALMLSSQTKDAQVGAAMRRLQASPGGLSVASVQAMDEATLKALIFGVGFHNNKTKYIAQATRILEEKHGGDIPPTAEEMIADLPGVGPKMAYLVDNIAWGRVAGIGVDTHMHRMFNLLGWVKSKNPEDTRLQLEHWLPREHWGSVNLEWVGFGQETQQEKGKSVGKALGCSRPGDALRLMRRVGLDVVKEGEKIGRGEEVREALRKKGEGEEGE